MPPESKPVVEIKYNEPSLGVPDASVNLEDIFGNLGMVTTTPTWTPKKFIDGLALDSTTGKFYYYDFTNKAWKSTSGVTAKGTASITSSATPTIDTDANQYVTITALATAITSFTTNLSGTPTNFQPLVIRIKDDGTARAITWGASFVAEGATLPTTTTAGKVLTVGFMYDSVKSKWGCIGAITES